MSAQEASLELAHEALANDPTDRPSQLFASNTFRPFQASMDALTARAAGDECLRELFETHEGQLFRHGSPSRSHPDTSLQQLHFSGWRVDG